MISPIFDSEDTNLYSTWHSESGGIVSLIVPNVGEIRMTLTKAEQLASSLAYHAQYGRQAAKEDK